MRACRIRQRSNGAGAAIASWSPRNGPLPHRGWRRRSFPFSPPPPPNPRHPAREPLPGKAPRPPGRGVAVDALKTPNTGLPAPSGQGRCLAGDLTRRGRSLMKKKERRVIGTHPPLKTGAVPRVFSFPQAEKLKFLPLGNGRSLGATCFSHEIGDGEQAPPGRKPQLGLLRPAGTAP